MTNTELHTDLRTAVRELCSRFPDSYWREIDAQAAYPEEFVRALTEAGYLAALIPEDLGGSGLGIAEASVILEEVNRSGGNSAACHAQLYIMGTLLRHGSAAQRAHYLPKLARGELRLQAFAVTEPTTGTDTTQMKTMAVRRGDRYVVNGQKVWISRVEHSDLMLLVARTTPLEEVKKRTEGLSVFLVDLREAIGHGMTVRPIRAMINHASTEVFFDNLEVPVENRVGDEGQGFRYLLDGLNAERILIAAECVGDGRWFIERASRYARDRVVFGRPIGQNQGIQFPIARAYVNVEAADLMRIRAADLFDASHPCGAEANMAKLLAADASWEAANVTMQTYGGYGFAQEYDIERKFRETRLYQTAPISTNLILSYIGQHVLDLPPVVLRTLMRPLNGVTVLSLEQAVAAPFTTRQLADLGARVIKIERPGVGDFARGYDTTVRGLSSHFVWLNRSKESLTLDVKHPDASDVLRRLLDGTDVFVQNLAPGATARLGLSAAVLRAAHPRLIVCEISGYGSSGPCRDRKAYDLLIQAEAGLVSITGTAHEPVKVAIPVADIAAGMYAYSGILTALLMRHQTGAGTVLEVSMLEALGEWMGFPMYYGTYGGADPPRTGAHHAAIAPYGPFAGGDGEVVYLGVQNEREWRAFCRQVLRRPALAGARRFASNAARVEHRAALDAEIERTFARLPTPEILERLGSARIANARLRTVRQFADHPQLAARRRWHEVGTPAGPVRALAPPATIDSVEPVMGPVPSLGAHTDAILAELGFDTATIAGWRDAGVV